MKTDKFRLTLIAVLTMTMLAGVIMYGYFALSNKEINFGSLLAFLVPLILGIFMIFFVVRRYKDIKQGMPLEDERSKQVMTKAAAQTFFISLYWLLFISMFESFFARMFGVEQLTASQTTGGGIAGMSVIFFICWAYYDKKGKLL